MKGGFGCSPCCVPCDPCTRTCQNPHTGTAFEAVYTRYFEGAEAGNTTDGYLTATGDSDTSDPYDGMDGDGPWYQRVSGEFTLGGSSPGTRFPCSVVVSFWRNNYVLGASTIPPPSSALTENIVEVIVSTGSLVAPDGRVITAADGAVTVGSVPLVSGGGDASTSDPKTWEGTISYFSLCDNVETAFTIRATIRWNTQKRQHVLYGVVRECYEEPGESDDCCTGSTTPNELYVTISNYTGVVGTLADGTPLDYNGTYVLERATQFCDYYVGVWAWSCVISTQNPLGESLGVSQKIIAWIDSSGYRRLFFLRHAFFSNVCRNQGLYAVSSTTGTFCGTGVIASGSNGTNYLDLTPWPSLDGTLQSGAFDWEIEA